MSQVVFDLDDTLVRYSTQTGVSVPRQTWHCLRDLHLRGVYIAVVSYNCFCHHIAEATGLSKYANTIKYGTEDRWKLVSKALQYSDRPFVYFDDRKDNLQNVMKRYLSQVICVYVRNPLELYKQIKQVLMPKQVCAHEPSLPDNT